jgi:diguanylate cyclase (GGDEF)-like protein
LNVKCIVIIRDELEAYTEFLRSVEAADRFEVCIVEMSHVLSPEFVEELSKTRPQHLALALRDTLYNEHRQHIQDQFRAAFNTGFYNYILLKTGPCLESEDIMSGKTHCFYLGEPKASQTRTTNFMLYAVKVFNEVILSERLQDYIINAVESIVDSEMLKRKKEEIELLNRELERKNRIDTLTNLYNRQAVFEILDRETKRVFRQLWRLRHAQDSSEEMAVPEAAGSVLKHFGTPCGGIMDHFCTFSVMMVDVDHFKYINDTYGHVVGDVVLRTIGELLNKKNIFRETDIIGRFGGEEFIGFFPETRAHHVLIPARRFMDELRRHEFTAEDGSKFSVTISAGIAEFSWFDTTCEEVITRADKAMYWVKGHGRNNVAVYHDVFPDDEKASLRAASSVNHPATKA